MSETQNEAPAEATIAVTDKYVRLEAIGDDIVVAFGGPKDINPVLVASFLEGIASTNMLDNVKVVVEGKAMYAERCGGFLLHGFQLFLYGANLDFIRSAALDPRHLTTLMQEVSQTADEIDIPEEPIEAAEQETKESGAGT